MTFFFQFGNHFFLHQTKTFMETTRRNRRLDDEGSLLVALDITWRYVFWCPWWAGDGSSITSGWRTTFLFLYLLRGAF